MDLGFHPLYVVILLALALIVFGPSRLPKMGAQVGRMMREFQAARDGLTQQMREAFEERPEPVNFAEAGDAEPDVAVEAESEESGGSSVAVLDPPADDVVETGGAVSDAPVVDAEAGAPDSTATDAGVETAPVIDEAAAPVVEPGTEVPESTATDAGVETAPVLDEAPAPFLEPGTEVPESTDAETAPVTDEAPASAAGGTAAAPLDKAAGAVADPAETPDPEPAATSHEDPTHA